MPQSPNPSASDAGDALVRTAVGADLVGESRGFETSVSKSNGLSESCII